MSAATQTTQTIQTTQTTQIPEAPRAARKAQAAQAQAETDTGELRLLIAKGDTDGVVAYFTGVPESRRRRLVKPLREHLKTLVWGARGTQDWRTLQERRNREWRPLLVAGVAAAASAGSVAKWIRGVHRAFGADLRPVDPLVKVLAERSPEWLAELPDALIETLEWSGGASWELAEAIAALSGTAPTASTTYVLSWAASHSAHGGARAGSEDRMRQDPRLDEFLPRVFEDDGGDAFLMPWSPFRQTLQRLLAEGRVERGPLLDALLGRLLRGGRPAELTNALSLVAVMEPTAAEYRARISSCVSLLSSANGAIARAFLAIVKTLSDAEALDVETALEAVSITVTRSEKNIVRTSLGWLDALVARHPDRAGEIVPVIATAFASQASDLQERAAKLVAKRAKLLNPSDCEHLVDGGRFLLPPDLAAMLATALGVGPVAAETSVASATSATSATSDSAATAATTGAAAFAGFGPGFPETAPYVPRPMPGPIATPAEAAEVFTALVWRGPDDPMTVERFLEAMVEFSRTDSAALRAAFAPVVEADQRTEWQRRSWLMTPQGALGLLAEAAAGVDPKRLPHRATPGELWSRMNQNGRRGHWNSRVAHNGPLDVLAMRVMELVAALGAETLPPLVAVPTSANGSIDPAVLAERLRRCEAEGREPLAVDFQQALLRLPHDCGAPDASGFTSSSGFISSTGFTSSAGRAFAAWVGGDRADLPTVAREPHKKDYAWAREPGLTLRSSALPEGMTEQAKSPANVDSLFDVVRAVWDAPGWAEQHPSWYDCMPAILPADPDLVAVALAPPLHFWSRDTAPTVPALLAEADAPKLDALHFVIADRLLGGDVPGRAGAVDAALVLASRGLLDAPLLGADMVSLLTTTETAGLRKAVPCLRDLANAGAARQVWDLIAGTVAEVLPPKNPKSLAGTTDLLALATEIAATLGIKGQIPAVAELAARKGSGNVTSAARRLNSVLAPR